jgi:hypothetical protein
VILRARKINDVLTEKAGLVILVLALFSTIQMAAFSRQNRQDSAKHNRQTECQSEYNNRVSQVLRIRAEYGDEDRATLVKFIREIAIAQNRSESRKALSDYLKKQDQIDQARAAHPIPVLPAGSCS